MQYLRNEKKQSGQVLESEEAVIPNFSFVCSTWFVQYSVAV